MSVREDDIAPNYYNKTTFGQKILKIAPALGGGVITGLVYFIQTSNAKKSHLIFMGSSLAYMIGTMGYSLFQQMKAIEELDQGLKNTETNS